MADLVTHLCTALLPGAWLPRRVVGALALGAALPDLVSRVPPLGLELVDRVGLATVPDIALFPWGVLHEPVGLVLLCGIGSFAFVERDRPTALVGLLLGCALHLGLDVLQDHHGQGYFLLAPFLLRRFELGWIGSEATVPWALPLAALTAAAWGWRTWRDRADDGRSGRGRVG